MSSQLIMLSVNGLLLGQRKQECKLKGGGSSAPYTFDVMFNGSHARSVNHPVLSKTVACVPLKGYTSTL